MIKLTIHTSAIITNIFRAISAWKIKSIVVPRKTVFTIKLRGYRILLTLRLTIVTFEVSGRTKKHLTE